MPRRSPGVVSVLVFAACSTKAPATGAGDSPRLASTPPLPPIGAPFGAPAAAPESGAELTLASATRPDPREAMLSAIMLRLLQHDHLLRKTIDDAVSREAFATYLKQLDPGKMFLLRADRDALAAHTDKIDDQLRAGSLQLAHDGIRAFTARVAVVEKLVAELLAAPFDFRNEEWIELDPDKIELAATEPELKERWRRRLELEVLDRIGAMEARLKPDKPAKPDPKAGKKDVKKDAAKAPAKDAPARDAHDEDRSLPLASIPPTPEGREAKARADLAKTYSGRFVRLRNPGPLDPASDLINAVASVLDPHTTYLPPADRANFDIHMSGSVEGIGASLRERDHYIEVVEIVPGGASWRHGGLAAGDLILSVQSEGQEPVDVVDMRIDEVVKMIRGKKGTVVRLRIQKPTGNEETIAITRDVVVIEEAYARGAVLTRPGQPAYGYIHLPSFYGGRGAAQRTAAGDVHRLLGELRTRKVAGVVLDVRSNGGGLLGDAIEITGDLIDQGPVVQVKDNRGRNETLTDDQRGTQYDGPVIVLVDRFSASASEILAGALQDYKRAVVVGTGPTHGKGTVQTLADLDRATGGKSDLGVLKITVQQFFRVTGSSTQREGVVPDIVLPDPAGHLDTGERELDHAIVWSQIAPVPHDHWSAPWKTSALVARSAARVAKHPVLSKVATATALLRTRRDDTKVPLARPAWETRRKEQRAAFEAVSPDLKDGPSRFTVTSVSEPTTAPPGPGGRPDDRLARWRDDLARDAWIEECLNILGDMKR